MWLSCKQDQAGVGYAPGTIPQTGLYPSHTVLHEWQVVPSTVQTLIIGTTRHWRVCIIVFKKLSRIFLRSVGSSEASKKHVTFFQQQFCDYLVVDPSWTEVVLQSPGSYDHPYNLSTYQACRHCASFIYCSRFKRDVYMYSIHLAFLSTTHRRYVCRMQGLR